MTLYVGNISYQIKENDLEKVFSEIGEVESVKIITDEYSGRSKGFGFVSMREEKDTLAAIKILNGKDIKGNRLLVNQARIKSIK